MSDLIHVLEVHSGCLVENEQQEGKRESRVASVKCYDQPVKNPVVVVFAV